MRRFPIVLLISVLLFACGSSKESTHEARFQKRRHVGGWQLDLSPRRQDAPQRTRLSALKLRTAVATISPRIEDRQPLTMREPDPSLASASSYSPVHSRSASRAVEPSPAASYSRTEEQEEDENLMPRKRWNAVAVPAFVAALGAVALGFGTNLWLLGGAIVLTFILSAWSIARIRRKEQAGKGFTIAALIIGVLTALLTLMSIGRYGTEL